MPIAAGDRKCQRTAASKTRILSATCLCALGLAACGTPSTDETDGRSLWSSLPHTMGCTVEPSERQRPPETATVRSVSVDHISREKIRVQIEFIRSAPTPPKTVTGPDGREFDIPGSISYTVQLGEFDDENVVLIDSPSMGKDWRADRWDGPDPDLLVSAQTSDKVATLVLDLADHQDLLSAKPFQPRITVNSSGGTGLALFQGGTPVSLYARQVCDWDTEISAGVTGPPSTTRRAPSSTRPAPSTTRKPTPAPGSSAEMRWVFQSPTGNIACTLTESGSSARASCELKENLYDRYPVSNCARDRPVRFTLAQGGRAASISCPSSGTYPPSLPTQDYGRPISVGSITCTLDENSGVLCKDKSTGRYFQAARQYAKWG